MDLILHTADLHLGAPFAFLPEAEARACRAAQFDNLTQLITRCKQEDCRALLIAGDFFDAPSPSPALVTHAFDLLSQADCPVFISPGNHDYLGANTPYRPDLLPENVHVFSSGELQPFSLNQNIVIWGAAFSNRNASISYSAMLDPNKCNLLLLHSDLSGTGSYNPLDLTLLTKSGFDYAAFGHNHVFSDLQKAGQTYYACPGCLMGTGLDDAGTKGYLQVSIQYKNVCAVFQPLDGILFETVSVPMAGLQNDHDLMEHIQSLLPKSPQRLCAMIRLTGEANYIPDTNALSKVLKSELFHCTLINDSHSVRDIWAALSDDDLRGAVTRRIHNLLNEPNADKELLTNALHIALSALEGNETWDLR